MTDRKVRASTIVAGVVLDQVGPERPAARSGPRIEAVVEPDTLKKALARVRRDTGTLGLASLAPDHAAQSAEPSRKSPFAR